MIKQLEESFRDLYLTLISIIQGVTVAFLAEHLFTGPHPTICIAGADYGGPIRTAP
ncbi:MAG: hypothetical protein JF597_01865 [Streptomyces sp.]|uniref:hypothetical protein n=1 Tax=Streptomyces sp. TaxID=1931 RepID=UPI0025EC7966|nr:hypothetical protein [Streptomyces sp.]MBW8792375.1 hypothetical protein [Streptomyces sp.]